MATLYVMCGVAGSGKSTKAEEIRAKNPDRTFVVSSDAIRGMFLGDPSNQDHPQIMFEVAYNIAETFLRKGFDVIFDSTSLTTKYRKYFIKKFGNYAEMVCVYCQAPLEVAIESQNLRNRKVPEYVICRQYERLTEPTYKEGWDKIIRFVRKEI